MFYRYWTEVGGWRFVLVFKTGSKWVHLFEAARLATHKISRADFERGLGIVAMGGGRQQAQRTLRFINRKEKTTKRLGFEVPTQTLEKVRRVLSEAIEV
jgi:hypothetical protein